MGKIVLGFDVSSSTIGWSVLEINSDDSIKYISASYFKPTKKGEILEKIISTREKIIQIINDVKPDYIGIEDLIKFMPKSTATTVVVLATFNRMVCVSAYDYLKDYPKLLNVMTIRHGLKLNKDLPKKEDMPDLVAKHLGITFPYEYKKSGSVKEESRDMADAVAVALYYALFLTGKTKKPKSKKK
jgi:Holliday junction resolvasome RuvABC endonuclease subunit